MLFLWFVQGIMLILLWYVVFGFMILWRARRTVNGHFLIPELYRLWPLRPIFALMVRRNVFLTDTVDLVLQCLASDGIDVPRPVIYSTISGINWRNERGRIVLATCFSAHHIILVNPAHVRDDPAIQALFTVCHEMGHWVDYHHGRTGHWFTEQFPDADQEYFANVMAWYILQLRYYRICNIPFDRENIEDRVAHLIATRLNADL